ncbi:MAG: hypothetical protein AAB229_09890 [Candidatus Hydrogenedentota bacterium]
MPYYWHFIWTILALAVIAGGAGHLLFLLISRANPGDARMVEAAVRLRKNASSLRLQHERVGVSLAAIASLFAGREYEVYEFRKVAACAVGATLALILARRTTVLLAISPGRIAAALRKSDEAARSFLFKFRAAAGLLFCSIVLLALDAWAFLGEGTAPAMLAGASTIALAMAHGAGMKQGESGDEDRVAMETALVARDFAALVGAIFCASLLLPSLPLPALAIAVSAATFATLRSFTLLRALGAAAHATAASASQDKSTLQKIEMFQTGTLARSTLPASALGAATVLVLFLMIFARGISPMIIGRGEFILCAFAAMIALVALRKAPAAAFVPAAATLWLVVAAIPNAMVWYSGQSAGIGWTSAWFLAAIPAAWGERSLPARPSPVEHFRSIVVPSALATFAFSIMAAW